MTFAGEPDDVTPDAVASRSFAFVKRGYDVREVRAFLDEVAAELRVMRDHAADLQRRLADTEDRLEAAHHLDEDQVSAKLGTETVRVLDAARAAGAETRARAEEEAAGIVRRAEATAELARVQADDEVARRLAECEEQVAERLQAAAEAVVEARHQAEQLIEEGRREGRAMVEEGRAVRERMLRDLSRRRRTLRQQIDQLQTGRDRLLAVFAVMEHAAEQATHELEVAVPEDRAATEDVEDGTGPVALDPEVVAAVEVYRAARTERGEPVLRDELSVVPETTRELPAVGPRLDAPPAPDAMVATVRSMSGIESVAAVHAAVAPVGGAVASGVVVDTGVLPAEPGPGPGSRHAAFERAGADVPLARSPDEPEGRHSSSVRVIARSAEDVDIAPAVAAVAGQPAGLGGPPAVPDGAREAPGGRSTGVVDDDRVPPVPSSPTSELFSRLREEQVVPEDETARGWGTAADEAHPGQDQGRAAASPTSPLAARAPSTPDLDDRPGSAADQPAEDQPVAMDDPMLDRRRADLEGLVRTLGRRLKRTMADEQNELLEALRDHLGVVTADLVLSDERAHVQRFADAALPSLAAAASAGAATARWAWPELAQEGPRSRVGDVAEALATELVASVRDGVAERLADGTDDLEAAAEAVREAYRAVRLGPLDELAASAAQASHQRALLASMAADVPLRWVRPVGHGVVEPCAVCAGEGPGRVSDVGDGARPAAEGCPALLVPDRPARHAS